MLLEPNSPPPPVDPIKERKDKIRKLIQTNIFDTMKQPGSVRSDIAGLRGLHDNVLRTTPRKSMDQLVQDTFDANLGTPAALDFLKVMCMDD